MLSLKVEGHAGQDIKDVIYDMTILACKLDVCVEMNINGIITMAFPSTDPVKLEEAYQRTRALGLKVASA